MSCRVFPAIISPIWLLGGLVLASGLGLGSGPALASGSEPASSPAEGAFAPTKIAAKKTLTITGWPLNWQLPVWQLAEEDPVFSTMVCPALTQLNLAKKKSEPLLIKSIAESGNSWLLTLDPSARLWDGQQVTSKAIEAFLRKQLEPHVERMFGGKLSFPKAKITAAGKSSVKVSWQRKPGFGPYVLSSLPFRAETKTGWQCAGAFMPLKAGDAKLLTLAPSQSKVSRSKRAKFSYIAFAKSAKSVHHHIDFRFAESYAGNPWARLSDKNISCKKSLPSSVITAIMWNPKGPFTHDRQFRGAMTHLTPRGALLRSGSGNLGKLVSAPIPRHHPGYHRRVFVRSFSYPKAIKILEQLGYKRPVYDKPRMLPDGKSPLVLKIGTLSPEGPLHKVLSDSFMSVGIDLEFVKIADPSRIPAAVQKSLDGVLMGLKLPYPSANILPLLTASPFADGYASLARHFIPYLRSLTTSKPDFGKLRTAHVALYQQEPFSVLMQYSQCLKVKSPKITVRKAPDVKNPSWLKNLIF